MSGTGLGLVEELVILSSASGLWRVAAIMARGRAAVALKRARGEATVAVLERLPPGARLHEHDRDGHHQTIEIPGLPIPLTTTIRQGRDDTTPAR